MANVVITMRILPESPEIDLEALSGKIKDIIKNYTGMAEFKEEIVPIAFGLKAIKLLFLYPEDKGDTEELENQIKEVEGVSSVEIMDVRRSLG